MKNALLNILVLVGALTAGHAMAASYSGIDFPEGELSFADSVVSYTPGGGFAPSGNCQNASNALGSPNFGGGQCDNYVSLGHGGSLVVQFTDNALTTSGDDKDDLFIFEIGGAIESMFVAISMNGLDWIDIGKVIGQPTSIDIDGVAGVQAGEAYSYVKVTDANDRKSGGVWAGADIDAIGAISSISTGDPVAGDDGAQLIPTPLPAAGWMLFAGVLGLGALRRSRRNR